MGTQVSHIPWDWSNHCLIESFSRSLDGSINIKVFYAKQKTFCMRNGEKMHSKNTADCDDYSSLRGGGTPAFNPCSESGKRGLNLSLLM